MQRIVLGLVVLAACGGSRGPSVTDYVDAVTTVDGTVHATFVPGSPPGDGSGPVLDVTTNPDVIPGGTTPVFLDTTDPFSTAVIAVDGVDGYYRLDLGAATSTAGLLVTLSQELDVAELVWLYGVGTGGSFSTLVPEPVTVVSVGTGDVQVSLSWSTLADVDLHVIDPSGTEIYYGNRASPSGGMLDLDSNAGCGSDGPRNENITWPTGTAPSGTYKVLVDYWSSCGADATPFTVTVNTQGSEPQTFSGTLTGSGDLGGLGSGMQLTTFTDDASAKRSHRVLAPMTFEPVPGHTFDKR